MFEKHIRRKLRIIYSHFHARIYTINTGNNEYWDAINGVISIMYKNVYKR